MGESDRIRGEHAYLINQLRLIAEQQRPTTSIQPVPFPGTTNSVAGHEASSRLSAQEQSLLDRCVVLEAEYATGGGDVDDLLRR